MVAKNTLAKFHFSASAACRRFVPQSDVLRCWAVDPELCPKCSKEMKRSKTLMDQHELQRLLKNLDIGLYPVRPRSPPPPSSQEDLAEDAHFSACDSQIPEHWNEWDAA